jgi:putative transcriptional regulator
VKVVKSNLKVLIAQKVQREGGRSSVRAVATETGISYYTLSALANNTIREYPKEVLERLCTYFDCSIGDLLTTEDVPDEEVPNA